MPRCPAPSDPAVRGVGDLDAIVESEAVPVPIGPALAPSTPDLDANSPRAREEGPDVRTEGDHDARVAQAAAEHAAEPQAAEEAPVEEAEPKPAAKARKTTKKAAKK